jgi:hypothetical protein
LRDYQYVRFLFGLASGGVYIAFFVAKKAVRSYRTVSPLPILNRIGGLFSVALSITSINQRVWPLTSTIIP